MGGFDATEGLLFDLCFVEEEVCWLDIILNRLRVGDFFACVDVGGFFGVALESGDEPIPIPRSESVGDRLAGGDLSKLLVFFDGLFLEGTVLDELRVGDFLPGFFAEDFVKIALESGEEFIPRSESVGDRLDTGGFGVLFLDDIFFDVDTLAFDF